MSHRWQHLGIRFYCEFKAIRAMEILSPFVYLCSLRRYRALVLPHEQLRIGYFERAGSNHLRVISQMPLMRPLRQNSRLLSDAAAANSRRLTL